MANLEDLLNKPVEFFRELQIRYAFKDPEYSKLCKEIADEHERKSKQSK